MGRLQNKRAIITGGASGIGWETAKLFIREGATVVITDRNREAGEQAAQKLDGQAVFFEQDVTDEASWPKLFDFATEVMGLPNLLINNAGILRTGRHQTLEDTDLAEWKAVNAVNAEGVFLGCKAAILAMKEQGGAIVNMASVAANQSTPDLIAYGASKAAVAHITKSVAAHCLRKRYPVRCNSVHPNPIKTAMGDELMAQIGHGDIEKGWAAFAQNPGTGGIGQPEDVAQAILFLASDEARHTTGAELMVDGGMNVGSN
ncbi:MAG: glucose 1-dehydrogenase [Sneathiella sp.]